MLQEFNSLDEIVRITFVVVAGCKQPSSG